MPKFPMETLHVSGTTKQFFQTQTLCGQGRVMGRSCEVPGPLVWTIRKTGSIAESLPVADLVARSCDLMKSGWSEEPLAGSRLDRLGSERHGFKSSAGCPLAFSLDLAREKRKISRRRRT